MSLLIPALALALSVFDFRRTMAWLEHRAAPRRTPRDIGDGTRRRLTCALGRARRYAPYRGNCLSQSLALWWLLRRRGITAELMLGATVDGGQFSAHAWVEARGVVLNDRADVRTRFAPLGSASALKWN